MPCRIMTHCETNLSDQTMSTIIHRHEVINLHPEDMINVKCNNQLAMCIKFWKDNSVY